MSKIYKTQRPTNVSLMLYSIATSILTVTNLSVEDKYVRIGCVAISQIILLVSLLLKQIEKPTDTDDVNLEIDQAIADNANTQPSNAIENAQASNTIAILP